ncbi:putative Ig domain-containing protein, partial [Spirosoma soli]
MKPPFRFPLPALQRLVYSATSLLVGLTFVLSSHSVLGQGIYATPGLYNYTVPAGGPFQIRVTARGGDGGELGNGGSGATIASTVTVQSGDVLTVIVGQSGRSTANYSGGGGGGGSAVIVNRNGTRAVLVAAGGGGGGGSVTSPPFGTFMYPGGGGQGLGATNAGKGGITNPNDDNAGGGGGGGLAGPGSNGGGDTGGNGGGAASLTAVSAGGGVFHDTFQVNGGSGFGGGGSFAGDFGSIVARGVGGGGGGYGGGNGAISGSFTGADRDNPIYHATGGYSYVAISAMNTSITPGTAGGSQNDDGQVTITFPQNTARATLSPDQSTCPGLFRTLQGTVSATGSWTLVLSDGTVGTGSGTTFSIPVRPVSSTTYTIASLSDQRGFAPVSNLTGQAVITSNPGPTVSLTSNGLIGCSPYNVTLTASGGTSYTFSSGNTILPGDPASNIRVVHDPGNYSVLGIDGNGCVSSATTTVNQSTAPPQPYTFTPEGSVLFCSFPSTRIGVAVLGATAIKSYTFIYGNTIIPGDPADPYRYVTSPGEYTVLVTGINNCTASATQTITKANEVLPVVSLANNGPLTCAQSSVTLTATSDQSGPYTFKSGSTTLDEMGSRNTRTVSSPGEYTVVVMGSNSCTSSATTTVTQLPLTPPTVSLTNNGPLSCAQSSVTLTAVSNTATSYVFTNGSTPLAGSPTSKTRVVSSPGVYSVVVTDANGCTNSASTTVTATSSPIAVVNPATTSFVVNQAVSQAFTASGGVSGSPGRPYSFSVASGSLPPGLSLLADGQLSGSPTQTGSFTAVIQATDANGCLGVGVPYEPIVSLSAVTGPAATYATPGLYTYTVPAGGPYRVWLTARGGDGGAESLGGTGSRVEGSYFVQSGDLLTVIVGQSGRLFSRGGGGGGGGSAIVLTHSGVQTLLVAAGGGGGGGQATITPGGGGQGLGPSTGGVGGRSTANYSGGGGGGGLNAPGGNGGSGFDPGGTGGGAASLTAPSVGGPYRGSEDGSGGSGFGGGGGVGGGDSVPGRPVGGGGGGYGGGDGGDNGAPVDGATGGYSYVSPAGSNTSVTPGIGGASRNREGVATIGFGQNTATAAITTTNLAVCQGTPSLIEGTVSATGNWTLVLTNGLTTTGSGTRFSIPVSPASPITYTIESLLDDQGFAPVSNLSGQASVTSIKPVPTVSLTNNGPLTCTQPSVTLTASGATAYTFTTGSLSLAGDPASNNRVVTSPGTYSVVGVSPNGCTNSATTTVTSVATVTVVNPATALFVVGQAVSQAFTASGGVSPRSFSVASGSLPPGLSLSADGQLSGSPTQTGSFPLIIQATDANGCPGLGTPYEVNITQPVDMSLTATYTTPGLYTYTVPAGGPYRVWLTARGGDGGAYSIGGTGARVEGSYTVQSGDLLTVIVGQSGKLGLGGDGNGGGGGGGGGSAIVLTHNGVQTL